MPLVAYHQLSKPERLGYHLNLLLCKIVFPAQSPVFQPIQYHLISFRKVIMEPVKRMTDPCSVYFCLHSLPDLEPC